MQKYALGQLHHLDNVPLKIIWKKQLQRFQYLQPLVRTPSYNTLQKPYSMLQTSVYARLETNIPLLRVPLPYPPFYAIK